jgi:hypothetical protein
MLMSGDLGGGVPPPLTLIYRGHPLIKLLLFRAFLESLDFITEGLYNISLSLGIISDIYNRLETNYKR